MAALIATVAMAPFPAFGASQEPLRLTLHDAVAMAARQHVAVLVGRERVQQALARLGQARSVLLPQLRLSGAETRQTRNLEAAGITLPGREPLVGPFHVFDARITLSQTLFDAGALQRLRAVKAGQALSLTEYDRARQDAMALVATLYLDAERATQRLELAHALLTQDAERLRLAQTQHAAGLRSSLEREQAQAAYVRGLAQWQAALVETTERRLDLAAALGLPPQRPVLFLPEDSSEPAQTPSDEQARAAVAQHPQVISAEQLVRERRAEQAAERSDALPRLSVNADYGASGRRPDDAEHTYTLGVQATMPLFEGGRRVSRAREAAGALRESEAQRDDVQRHVESQALGAREMLRQTQASVQAADAAFAVSAKQLALARQRHRNGLGSALEVTESVAQTAQARDQYEEALAADRLAHVNLLHAMGTLDATINTDARP